MQPRPDNTLVKRGANLLLQGATLTDLACPVCSSPLFRLKDGTLWCAKDEKKVIVVKEGARTTQTNHGTQHSLRQTRSNVDGEDTGHSRKD